MTDTLPRRGRGRALAPAAPIRSVVGRQEHSAIDEQHRAGYVRSVWRAQKRDRPGDVFRLSGTGQRNLRDYRAHIVRIRAPAKPGIDDKPRTDSINRDAMRRELKGEAAGEHVDAPFARIIVTKAMPGRH